MIKALFLYFVGAVPLMFLQNYIFTHTDPKFGFLVFIIGLVAYLVWGWLAGKIAMKYDNN